MADFHAVETSGEPSSVPSLKGDCISSLLKLRVGPDKGRSNPALFPARCWLGTAPNDLRKELVDRELELPATDRPLQPPWHMQTIQRQDAPRIR